MQTTATRTCRPNTSELLPLEQYDKIVVAFSGGKDSEAAACDLLERGVSPNKIEFWHHHIDGAPSGTVGLMDWPVTEAYCRKVAEELGISIRFSWKDGGFEREMLRKDELTAPTSFEATDGIVMSVGGVRGTKSTRRLFPQKTANLSTRWCSAYLKIDVAKKVFANDPAFKHGTFLLITGERREESPARAMYAEVERHSTTTKNRRVDQWRSIIDWTETEVWAIIERHRIVAHPAYRIHFGRVSCMFCIFGDVDQWATLRDLDPERFEKIAQYEDEFGKTIDRKFSIRDLADKGTSQVPFMDEETKALALSKTYDESVRTNDWQMPVGAFKKTGGPI